MTDHTELKRLAEDAIDDSRCRHDFQMGVTPKVVLSMLAEIEQLQRDFTYIKQQRDKLQDEVKNTRTNYSEGWDECIGQRDKLRSQNQALVEALEDATDEIESWGAYASEYFQAKYDLAGNVAKFRAIAHAEGGV